MKRLLLATTALALINFSAMAADLPSRAPAYAPAPVFVSAPSWGGFYGGLVGGYAQFNSKVSDNEQPYSLNEFPGDSFRHKPAGFVGGLVFGHNWQSGRFVFGIEADASFSNISKNSLGDGNDAFLLTKISGLGTLRGRLGYTILDNVLVYATGGLAMANFTQRAGDKDGNNTYWDTEDSIVKLNKWKAGWVIGAGVEAKLVANWTARAEYLYTNFGKYRASAEEARCCGNDEFRSGSFRNDAHIYRIGLTYQFGGASAAPVVARY